nr:MAG TPA: hypothetical protein [Caudoviricetes sp.]
MHIAVHNDTYTMTRTYCPSLALPVYTRILLHIYA